MTLTFSLLVPAAGKAKLFLSESQASQMVPVKACVFDEEPPSHVQTSGEDTPEADEFATKIVDVINKAPGLTFVQETVSPVVQETVAPFDELSPEASAIVQAILAAKQRLPQAVSDFEDAAAATAQLGDKVHRRKGLVGDLSGRAEMGVSLENSLTTFDIEVKLTVAALKRDAQAFTRELQAFTGSTKKKLPFEAIYAGAYRTERAKALFAQIGLLLSLDDVSDEYKRFQHTIYGYFPIELPPDLLKKGDATPEKRVRRMRFFTHCPAYFGQGRPGRWHDHDGYALGHLLAEEQNRVAPKVNSKHIKWVKERFKNNRAFTKALLVKDLHPSAALLGESALLHYLKGFNNVANGVPVATISPELCEMPGADSILAFLGPYLFSILVWGDWAEISTVRRADAKLTTYPMAYFTAMVCYCRWGCLSFCSPLFPSRMEHRIRIRLVSGLKVKM